MSQVKQTKTVKPTAAATPVPVVAATPAPVVAAAKPKATKATKAEVAVAAPAPVVAAPVKKTAKVVEVTPVVEASTVAQTEATTEVATVASHDELETLANDMIKMAKRCLEVARQARKDFAKQVKKAEQGGKKRRVNKADGESSHSNSVFLQPSKISPELAVFCGVEPGTMLSRTDCTRKIAAYIKEHDLQNPDNRREILSDATLIKLFDLKAEDKLNYFNLQRYIKPHFIKEVKVVA